MVRYGLWLWIRINDYGIMSQFVTMGRVRSVSSVGVGFRVMVRMRLRPMVRIEVMGTSTI